MLPLHADYGEIFESAILHEPFTEQEFDPARGKVETVGQPGNACYCIFMKSGSSIAIGVAIGVVIGVAMDNIAGGIGIGLAIGIALSLKSRK